MALTMSLDIADRRLRYRIGGKHMCVKDGTRRYRRSPIAISHRRKVYVR